MKKLILFVVVLANIASAANPPVRNPAEGDQWRRDGILLAQGAREVYKHALQHSAR